MPSARRWQPQSSKTRGIREPSPGPSKGLFSSRYTSEASARPRWPRVRARRRPCRSMRRRLRIRPSTWPANPSRFRRRPCQTRPRSAGTRWLRKLRADRPRDPRAWLPRRRNPRPAPFRNLPVTAAAQPSPRCRGRALRRPTQATAARPEHLAASSRSIPRHRQMRPGPRPPRIHQAGNNRSQEVPHRRQARGDDQAQASDRMASRGPAWRASPEARRQEAPALRRMVKRHPGAPSCRLPGANRMGIRDPKASRAPALRGKAETWRQEALRRA
jgi:hypothetical protein